MIALEPRHLERRQSSTWTFTEFPKARKKGIVLKAYRTSNDGLRYLPQSRAFESSGSKELHKLMDLRGKQVVYAHILSIRFGTVAFDDYLCHGPVVLL